MTSSRPDTIRFDNRTWTVTRTNEQYMFVGIDHVDEVAFAALTGTDASWAARTMYGVNDAASRGLIGTVEEAVHVIRRTRQLRRKLDLAVHDNPAVLVCASYDTDLAVLKKVAGNPHTPADILRRYVTSTSTESRVRAAALKNPSLPTGTVDSVNLSLPDLARRLEVTRDDSLLAAHLDDRRVTVRRALAKNPHVPEQWLDEHATDGDPWVCWHVADNPSLPEQTRIRVIDEWVAADNTAHAHAIGLWVRSGHVDDKLRMIAATAIAHGSDAVIGYLMLRSADLPADVDRDVRAWLNDNRPRRAIYGAGAGS